MYVLPLIPHTYSDTLHIQKRVVLMSYGTYACVVHVWVAESPLYIYTYNYMYIYIFHHMILHTYSDTLHILIPYTCRSAWS